MSLPSLQPVSCTLPEFPASISSHELMSTKDGVQACGGYVSGVGFSSECFYLPFNSQKWIQSPDVGTLEEKRYETSSFTMGEEHWIAGGYSYNGAKHLSSIEVSAKDGSC